MSKAPADFLPPRPRMVVLDIDGTLLDPSGALRSTVRDAVRQTLETGVLVTIATGRRFDSASAVARELGLELPLVLHGGTIIQDSETAEVLYEDVMNHALLCEVITEIVRHEQQPVLYTSPAAGGTLYTGPGERDSLATAQYLASQPEVRRRSYDVLPSTDHTISVGVIQSDDVLRPLYETLRTMQSCSVLLWDPDPMYEGGVDHLLDILNAGCSKFKALAHLTGRYGIHTDEVMAIGDQVNDLDLIGNVGLGVAMGNAIPAVQQCAKVVVGTNAEDGVVEALRRFVLDRPDNAQLHKQQ
ncbi:MAG: Cof-type HAD-IIB family hydrolase [Chloroflexia bacterium]|nr:Cof-type HAD-IIB family hydrolase [Chloroflexia bacterium]